LGLADNSKNPITQQPRVQILDPATGTGTFLYGVVNQIYQNLEDMGMASSWNQYVQENLLGRLFRFELLMAPYAIAHLKLGLQLQDLGYQFTGKQRLGIYLTNTLDEALKKSEVLFGQFVAAEANEASAIKRDVPVMVVLGNPPYSYESINTGDWIRALIRDYYKIDGQPLKERNPKGLQDDYVKFIRFAQWRIEQTGYGILAFITNHGYLDNPTFRGMRQSLMNTFDEIYVLDLHGNSKKKERNPNGLNDENIFDIQQGVAISIMIKHHNENNGIATVRHAHVWGVREVYEKNSGNRHLVGGKYHWLSEKDISKTEWTTLAPCSPSYLFIPQDTDLLAEYEYGWKLTDMMPLNSVGLYTARDELAIQWTKDDARQTIKDFSSLDPEIARYKYNLGSDSRDWQITLAQKDIQTSKLDKLKIQPISYRPFDMRFTYYTGNSRGLICMTRPEVMYHLLETDNLAICFIRRSREQGVNNFFVARNLIDKTALLKF